MSIKRLQIAILATVLIMISSLSVFAQDTLSFEKKILLRDSLDFINKPLSVNTSSNEFSPMPYKGGLLYISNKTVPFLKASYNKVYWSKDPNYIIADSANYKAIKLDTAIKYYRKGKTDDFTAPTSNDNDILVRYKKQNQIFNEVERTFLNFSTEQVFSYDERTNLIIYAKKASRRFAGVKHWELWQAVLVNGSLHKKSRINFEDRAADYLHPFINEQGDKLFFSSNMVGGKGGYDLYFVPIENNLIGIHPTALEGLNSTADEIMPSVYKDTVYFSSNRAGGLGGFDAYESVSSDSNLVVKNMGYPMNTEGDDVGVKKINNEFYLTSNRNGNFDILKLKHEPSVFTIIGSVAYNNDSTVLPTQTITIKDKATEAIIEMVKTDAKGNYAFNGKPNRTYELSTVNGNGLLEHYTLNTAQTKSLIASNLLTQNENKFTYNLSIKVGGTSVKQKQDLVQAYIVKEQKRVQDSLISYGLNGKFIVHYGFNKYNIAPKEQLVLDSLLKKLNHTPAAYVVIGGFTDCIGSYKYNLSLSVKRGKAVAAYLVKHGLDRKKIVLTGYSKNYNISPCLTKYGKHNHVLQQDSRRSEVVLSDTKNTNWALLEKQHGANYYNIFSAKNLVVLNAPTLIAKAIKPVVVKKDTIAKVTPVIVKKDTIVKSIVVSKPIVKKDTIAKVTPVIVKKDTIVKSIVVSKPIVKKDTIAKVIPIVVKKDTIAKVTPVVVKKDTIAKSIVVSKPIVKKDTIARVIPIVVKKDTIAKVAPVVVKKDTIAKSIVKSKAVVKKDTIARVIPIVVKKDTIAKQVVLVKPIVVTQAKQVESDELSKEDIIKALDSLAKLKREQERIVEYLTKRINNKPIEIFVSSDTVTIELYDNGVHDQDSVSVIYNNRIVVDKQELKVNQPIKFKLKVDKIKKNNELILVAENLGTEPPNTAVMFITEKSGKRQQVLLNTDLTHNSVIYFIRIGKLE